MQRCTHIQIYKHVHKQTHTHTDTEREIKREREGERERERHNRNAQPTKFTKLPCIIRHPHILIANRREAFKPH